MRSVQYRMEGSRFLLVTLEDGVEREVADSMDNVAIAYDGRSWTLLKHGSPGRVRAWAERTREAYRLERLDWMAESLCVVELEPGYPVAEINKALATSGYIKHLVEEGMKQLLEQCQDAMDVSHRGQ